MAHILIADDDELVAEMASDILIDAGHACGWVTNGEDAWALMQQRRPDLLLLDQDMPGISGVSLLRKLRGSAKFYDLPVIMFTAMQGEIDESRAIYAGAQDYVRKPFTPLMLTSRIERAIMKLGGSHLDLKTRVARDAGFLENTIRLERRPV
ncbi:response regulator [Erythrobacter crassostreae]|uniref:Response regulator n=1 Tax=Erythrobacter crassostreae TaxID=2828328 RepID=A0A9X1F6H8_9SPHN|nr:response regulator [Erythrobacter crassostrea]MBV7259715.1 response regulator [Erythrobacter crassostrea]